MYVMVGDSGCVGCCMVGGDGGRCDCRCVSGMGRGGVGGDGCGCMEGGIECGD